MVYVCIDLRLVTLETIHVRRRYIADFLAQGGLIKAILVYNYAESMSDLLSVLETAPNRIPVILTTEDQIEHCLAEFEAKTNSEATSHVGELKLPKFDLSPSLLGLAAQDLNHSSPDGSTKILIKHLEDSIYEQFRTIGLSREQHKGEPEFIENILQAISARYPNAKVSFLVNVNRVADLSLSSRGLMDLHKRLPVVGAVAFVGANVLLGRALGWGLEIHAFEV